MWKIIAITMIAVWVVSQAVMAVFCTWAVEKSLEQRDQKEKENKKFYYYLRRKTTVYYKDSSHDSFTKEDILGAYCTKKEAIEAMNKAITYTEEAVAGLTGHKPQVFDYPKWNATEVYNVNDQWKEHVWYDVKAF